MSTDPVLSSLVPYVNCNNVAIYLWSNMTQSAVGTPIAGPGFTDRSWQVEGNFGGATVTIEGSNDGVTYHTLNDPFGVPLTFIAGNLRQLTEIALYIRPNVVGGSGATLVNITAICCNHQSN